MVLSFRLILPLVISFLFILPSSSFAKYYYRYKNEEGSWVLDERIPPQFLKNGYTIYDENGIYKVVPPKAQTGQHQQVIISEAEREKRQREQRDRSLLSAYATVHDVQEAGRRRLSQLNRLIKDAEVSLDHLGTQEAYYKKTIVNHPSSRNKQALRGIQQQIEEYKLFAKKQEEQKQQVLLSTEQDILRFQFLNAESFHPGVKKEVYHVPGLAFDCSSVTACNQLWKEGEKFAEEQFPMRIRYHTAQRLLTEAASKTHPLAFMMGRIPQKMPAEKILMLVQCYPDVDQPCQSAEADEIYARFQQSRVHAP